MSRLLSISVFSLFAGPDSCFSTSLQPITDEEEPNLNYEDLTVVVKIFEGVLRPVHKPEEEDSPGEDQAVVVRPTYPTETKGERGLMTHYAG